MVALRNDILVLYSIRSNGCVTSNQAFTFASTSSFQTDCYEGFLRFDECNVAQVCDFEGKTRSNAARDSNKKHLGSCTFYSQSITFIIHA